MTPPHAYRPRSTCQAVRTIVDTLLARMTPESLRESLSRSSRLVDPNLPRHRLDVGCAIHLQQEETPRSHWFLPRNVKYVWYNLASLNIDL